MIRTNYILTPATLTSTPAIGGGGGLTADVLLAGTQLTVNAALVATPANGGVYAAGDRVIVHVFPSGTPGGLAAVVLGVLL